MKKIVSVFIAFIMLVSLSLCAYATDLDDGTYEVPVVLMHKEDEKESFGNKYVAQTALLKVENGQKTVTILLTTDMKGIEFSYYTNGSLSGDVAECTPVSNITVAGEAYNQGFEIPVNTDGDIGLQFSVPVMPMSPSARLRIDYSKAVQISAQSTTETTVTETTVTSAELTTWAPVTTATTEVITTTEQTIVTVTQAVVTYEETTVFVPETAQTENEEKDISPFVFIVLFVAATTGLAVLVTDESKKEKKDDDK